MKTTTLSVAVGLLLYSVSVAEATPIRGFFEGVVTYNSNPSASLPFLEGTPASAIFGYDTDYLSAPDAFGNRWAETVPPELEAFAAFFLAEIPAGVGLVGYTTGNSGNTLGLLIGPNGLPVAGGGAGYFDFGLGPNGFAIYELDLSTMVVVEGTFSLPDYESTLPLTVIGLAALALVRRFL
jgi:hypothetical protein